MLNNPNVNIALRAVFKIRKELIFIDNGNNGKIHRLKPRNQRIAEINFGMLLLIYIILMDKDMIIDNIVASGFGKV